MDLSATNFGVLDWGIVGVYLIITLAIGLYVRPYIANVTDFIVAGRGLKTYLAVATMVGTELGLVTVMYAAQMGFTGGFAAFHIGLATESLGDVGAPVPGTGVERVEQPPLRLEAGALRPADQLEAEEDPE